MAAPARRSGPSPSPSGGGSGRLVAPIPLTGLHLRRIAELEHLVGARYAGWAWIGAWVAVDVHERAAPEGAPPRRYRAPTLHMALGLAIRTERGEAP
jgi:hypothetical protein